MKKLLVVFIAILIAGAGFVEWMRNSTPPVQTTSMFLEEFIKGGVKTCLKDTTCLYRSRIFGDKTQPATGKNDFFPATYAATLVVPPQPAHVGLLVQVVYMPRDSVFNAPYAILMTDRDADGTLDEVVSIPISPGQSDQGRTFDVLPTGCWSRTNESFCPVPMNSAEVDAYQALFPKIVETAIATFYVFSSPSARI